MMMKKLIGPALAAALAALVLGAPVASGPRVAVAGDGVAAARGEGAPAAASGERLAPGTPLEIVAAQVDLLAMPPGYIRNVKAKAQNRIGVARRGARVALVMETDNFYEIALECQDGKVRVEAWIDKTAARPALERAPDLPR
ncbi:MAG: hypothetical protein ACYDIE_07735 [Candidatus Krumholzibacteriia bacterium]